MRQRGTLTVITGTMSSGKTSKLVRELEQMNRYGRKTFIAFKAVIPQEGARDPEGWLESKENGGRRIPAISVPTDRPSDILAHLITQERRVDVVGIDETQFFPETPGLWTVADKILSLGYDVVAAGLDLDFAGRPFGSTPKLLALADTVVKLTAFCDKCGSPARLPQRLTPSGEPESYFADLIRLDRSETAGRKLYETRCYQCHEVRDKPALFVINVTEPKTPSA